MTYAYQDALEAAGAEVHEFKEFNTTNSDWWAKVTWKGNIGWVTGYTGSCPECDAFLGEFGDSRHDCIGRDYSPLAGDGFRDGCEICQSLEVRLVRFGQDYLEWMMSQEEAEAKASENIEWDMEVQEMVDFILAHSIDRS